MFKKKTMVKISLINAIDLRMVKKFIQSMILHSTLNMVLIQLVVCCNFFLYKFFNNSYIVGSDGSISFWDKDSKTRLKSMCYI